MLKYIQMKNVAAILLTILILLPAFSLSAFNNTDEPVIKRDRKFTGSALYGFMNGGSDLYLEYGFKELRAIEVVYKGEEFTVEIYTMPTPEDAFGIYSLHTFSAIVKDTISSFDCHSKNQLQTVTGSNYISIVYEKSNTGVNPGAVELLNYFTRTFEKTPVSIPEIVTKIAPPSSGVLKYIRGPLAIMNSYGELDDIMSGIDSYKMWVNQEKATGRRFSILFYNNETFTNILKERVPATKIINSGKDYFVFEF